MFQVDYIGEQNNDKGGERKRVTKQRIMAIVAVKRFTAQGTAKRRSGSRSLSPEDLGRTNP